MEIQIEDKGNMGSYGGNLVTAEIIRLRDVYWKREIRKKPKVTGKAGGHQKGRSSIE